MSTVRGGCSSFAAKRVFLNLGCYEKIVSTVNQQVELRNKNRLSQWCWNDYGPVLARCGYFVVISDNREFLDCVPYPDAVRGYFNVRSTTDKQGQLMLTQYK